MVEEDKIEVAILGKTIYVRPSGYATQAISLGLPDFFDAMRRQGCTSVVFDFGQCCGMDSTFMGVIAGAAMSGTRPRGKSAAIVNADERIAQQLAFIGLLPVVAVVEEPVLLPADLRFSRAGAVPWPKTERDRIVRIKKLHEKLVQLNVKNKARFGAVIEMLDKELQEQHKGEQ